MTGFHRIDFDTTVVMLIAVAMFYFVGPRLDAEKTEKDFESDILVTDKEHNKKRDPTEEMESSSDDSSRNCKETTKVVIITMITLS